jgi:hypothetical protein
VSTAVGAPKDLDAPLILGDQHVLAKRRDPRVVGELLAAIVALRRLGEDLDEDRRVRDRFTEDLPVAHDLLNVNRPAEHRPVRIGRQIRFADVDHDVRGEDGASTGEPHRQRGGHLGGKTAMLHAAARDRVHDPIEPLVPRLAVALLRKKVLERHIGLG